MEPKDLKNSEELESTKKLNAEIPKKKIESAEEKIDDSIKETEEVKVKEETVEVVKKTVIEASPVEEKKAEPEMVEATVKAETEEKIVAKEEETVEEKTSKEETIPVAELKEEEREIIEKKETVVVPKKEETEPVVAESKKHEEKIEEGENIENKETAVASKKEETESVVAESKKPEEKIEEGENIENKETAVASKKEETEVIATESKKPEEKKEKVEVIKREIIDYTKLSQIELVNALRDAMDNPDNFDLKSEIEIIKSAFYKKRNENIEAAKKAFLAEGGLEEDFVAEEDPYENDIKDQLRRFRQIRIEHNKKLDQDKEENLRRKYEVIENIKGLINNEESINKTFNDFRDLQREWRDIGLVPQSKMKNLWDTYHFHVENFYDYIKINRELRDLDLKKNLEIKINLCESAEELLVEPSIIKAFNTLQKFHEQWREVGPVPRDNKDDIWDRFKTVTSKINKKHQEFFESRKVDQKKNLEAKTALCEKVEEICETEVINYREWDEISKELIELQKVWRTIGFAPKKDNNKIYERFRNACDNFFNKKREFYSKNKEIQQNNLQLKIDLCVQAEALKDSSDWKKTTQDLINIQKKWKEIGAIPRKHSDAVWKRFRAACDSFFDKKSEHFSEVDTEQVDNLKLKEDLIVEVENLKTTGDVDENLKTLKGFQRRWTEIGHVPFKKKDEIQNTFREAINKLFDELNIDDDKRNLLKFRSKMTSYSESNRGQNKMRMERDKYMNKLKQLESDLILLDNNIGFFAKSKNAESLIAGVKQKMEDSRQKIETLKEKIRVIDSMDN